MYKAVILFIAAFLCSGTYGSIGKLTEVTGPTEITRDRDKIEGKVDVSIEMEDRIDIYKADHPEFDDLKKTVSHLPSSDGH